jgi:hypothetical protein
MCAESAPRRARRATKLAVGVLAVVVAAAALCGAADAAGDGAVSVQAMVVGRGGRVLASPRAVLASAVSVSVAGRTCAVAADTPLAVLANLRSRGGPGFALRDYGHCSNSPASASELFVYSLGGEANRGQDGWEYKVGGAAGSTGAGDPSGARGNGRLLGAGERVLWFWCEATASGCERTLEVSATGPVHHGHAFTATVYGYENEGRGAPVAGARVTIGGRAALTNSHGRAVLIAPARSGIYPLTAARAGMVPAFPFTVAVR